MFAFPRARRWVGAASLLVVGVAVGCRHTASSDSSTGPPPIAPTMFGTTIPTPPTTAPPAPSVPAPSVPAPSAPAQLPAVSYGGSTITLDSLPTVGNERYVAPERAPTSPSMTVNATPGAKVTTEIVTVKPLLPPEPATPIVTIPTINRHPSHGPADRSYSTAHVKPEFQHSEDYSVLTGELSFIQSKNQWRLRYTPIDDEDRYGGSVTLDSHQLMKGCRSGQIVRIQGEMVDPEARGLSPMFRVKEVMPVSN